MQLGNVIGTFYAKNDAMPFDLDVEFPRRFRRLPPWLRRLLTVGPVIETDPVVGWRVWRGFWDQAEQDWLLASIAVPHRWLTGVVRNSRRPCFLWGQPGHAPSERCSPGFFVLNSRTRARSLLHYQSVMGCCFMAIGTVELSGHVVEHETGYRAQSLHIKKLEVSVREWRTGWEKLQRSLQKRYSCEVEFLPIPSHSAEHTTKFVTRFLRICVPECLPPAVPERKDRRKRPSALRVASAPAGSSPHGGLSTESHKRATAGSGG